MLLKIVNRSGNSKAQVLLSRAFSSVPILSPCRESKRASRQARKSRNSENHMAQI
jgi:hypothetical protein